MDDHYCNEPQPWGLGFPAEIAHAVIDEKDGNRRVGALVTEHQERMSKATPIAPQGRPSASSDKGAYTHLKSRGSESADYIASRIKRDRPDIAQAVERGEYASMRQAGIAASFVKRPGLFSDRGCSKTSEPAASVQLGRALDLVYAWQPHTGPRRKRQSVMRSITDSFKAARAWRDVPRARSEAPAA